MDNKIFPTLKTEYIENMDKENPWDMYPRPMMVRDSYLSLCGKWDFQILDERCGKKSFDGSILVPFPPESLLSGVERRISENDVMVYKRRFSLPEGFLKDRLILHFGAVDQVCEVFINGKSAGKNEGGYLPFSFDITALISPHGKNEIEVIARDALLKKYTYGKQKKKRGGMWYTPVSGIWQSVWMESIPKGAILSIKIEQNLKNAKITINSEAEHKTLTLKESGETYEFDTDSIIIEPKEPHLWTPSDPYLYEFELRAEEDKIESYFALRDISIGEVRGTPRILLNGKPYFFSALLDQGYYPDGIYLPATPDAYRDDILLAKRLGFNTLRKHIKIEPLIFYHLCDKLGMIVFQDMVNNSSYSFVLDTALPTIGFKQAMPTIRHRSTKTREFFLSQMRMTADLLYSFPSVCLYTIFNEGWGQFDADSAYRMLKEQDPTRIIDATSGWFSDKESDLDSRHIYFKAPTIKKTYGKPVFLSEFGGFSLRIDGHLFGKKNYGYSIYEDKESFSDAVYHLFLDGVMPLIEDGLCATVYTQLSDVEDETNGLITYDRAFVKIDEEKMALANRALYEEFDRLTKG